MPAGGFGYGSTQPTRGLLGELFVKLSADTRPMQRNINDSLQALDRAGRHMRRVGGVLTRSVTVPLLAVGGAAVKMATDFESSMSLIEGLVGESSAQVKDFSEQILRLGPEVGKSPKELADALYFIVSSGIDAADAIEVLEVSAKAATAGLGETQQVADAVTTVIGAYGIENISAAEATDILVAAVKEGKGEADELGASIGRVIPIAAQLGVPFHEVAAAMATMSIAGLDASEAATALRGIFTALIKPSQQANEILQGVGLSAEELRRQLREEGLVKVLETLAENFAGNEEAIGRLFPNVRGLVGALNLMNQSGTNTERIFDAVENSVGATEAAFRIAEETARVRFAKATSALHVAMIGLGNELLKTAVPAFETLVKVLTAAADLFIKSPPWVRRLILAVLGLAVLAGPMLIFAGSIIRAHVSLQLLGVTSTTVMAAVRGVTAAILPLIGAMGAAIFVFVTYRQMAAAARGETEDMGDTFSSIATTGVPALLLVFVAATKLAPAFKTAAAAAITYGKTLLFVGTTAKGAAFSIGLMNTQAVVGLTGLARVMAFIAASTAGLIGLIASLIAILVTLEKVTAAAKGEVISWWEAVIRGADRLIEMAIPALNDFVALLFMIPGVAKAAANAQNDVGDALFDTSGSARRAAMTGREHVVALGSVTGSSLELTEAQVAEREVQAELNNETEERVGILERLTGAQQDAIKGIQTWSEPLGGYRDALAEANDKAQEAFEVQQKLNEGLAQNRKDANKAIRDAEADHQDAVRDAREKHNETIADAEQKLNDAILEANRTRRQALMDLDRKFHDDRAQLIRDRADEIFSSLSIEIDLTKEFGNSIREVTTQVIDQNRQLGVWLQGVERLRRRGLTEAAIEALNLNQFSQESLAIVRGFRNATDAEVAKLNAAIAKRQKMAGNQAQSEAQRMIGAIGEGLRDLLRENQEATAQINRDHAQALEEANRDFGRTISEANVELSKALAESSQDLADAVAGIKAELAEKNAAERASAQSTDDMFKGMEESFNVYMKSLNKRLEDQRTWHKNLNIIREAAGDEYADLLMAQGIEEAGLVAEIAGQNESAIREARDKEFQIREEAGAEAIDLIHRTGELELQELIDSGELIVSASGVIGGDMVDEMAEELGLTPAMVRRILNDAEEVQEKRQTAMALLSTTKARESRVNYENGIKPVVENAGTIWQGNKRNQVTIQEETAAASKNQAENSRENYEKGIEPVTQNAGTIWQGNKRNQVTIQENTAVASKEGGGKVAGRYVRKLEGGAEANVKTLAQYGIGITKVLNPILSQMGAKTIEFKRRVANERFAGRYSSGLTRNEGGPIPGGGPDRDSVPAMLTPGEFVVRRKAVDAFGLDFMQAVNRMEGFQAGGPVRGRLRPPGGVGGEARRKINPAFLQNFTLWSNWLMREGRVPGGLSIVSGWRSTAQQAALYKAKPNLAAPPGRSNHERGLAIDHSPWSWNYNRTAGRFGMRHPMSWEGWHVEPTNLKATSALMVMPELPKVPEFKAGGMFGSGPRAARYLRDEAQKWLEENIFTSLTDPDILTSGGASGKLGSWIRAAMAATGVGANWFAPLVGLAKHESGGDPRAINLWDSNARAGIPSKGLMQTIEPTFRSYSKAGMKNIWNPVHNAVAAIRYILSRYGSIFRIPSYRGGTSFSGGYNEGGVVSFDNGGILQPGTTLAANLTGSPEVVVAQGIIQDEVSQGITEALSGKLPRLGIPQHEKFRREVAAAEETFRKWAAAWDLGITSTRERLKQLQREMLRTVPWSDEWINIYKERQQIINDLLDEHIQKVEAAIQRQQQARDDLVSMLKEEQDLLNQRRDALLGAYGMDVRVERVFANSARALIRNTQRQTEMISEQFSGLATLRGRGLSEDVIQAMSLEELSAESHAQITRLLRESDSDLAALGDAWAARMALVDQRVTEEHKDGLGQLGRDLAAIGSDAGMSYADALAAAMSSRAPAVAAAAEALKTAIAEVGQAEKGLTGARALAEAFPAAGVSAQRAPLGRLVRMPGTRYAVRLAGPPPTWWEVGRSVLPIAKRLWSGSKVMNYPNARPITEGWIRGGIVDAFGPGTLQRFSQANVAPKWFQMGGHIRKPMLFGAGEAGDERIRIDPLSKDMPTPHEKRMEDYMERLVQAAERGDAMVVLDTGVLVGEVTRRQRRNIRGERVAAGRAAWR